MPCVGPMWQSMKLSAGVAPMRERMIDIMCCTLTGRFTVRVGTTGDPNPFSPSVRFWPGTHCCRTWIVRKWNGETVIRDADTRIAMVAGTGFHTTPYGRNDALSDALGFTTAGGVGEGRNQQRCWFTQSPTSVYRVIGFACGRAGGRRGIVALSVDRSPLAIACGGNAALAAAHIGVQCAVATLGFRSTETNEALVSMLTNLGRAS